MLIITTEQAQLKEVTMMAGKEKEKQKLQERRHLLAQRLQQRAEVCV